MAALTLSTFKARTLMPSSDVDYVEQAEPGFTAKRIDIKESYIYGRLRKRYGKSIPFSTPPEIFLGWLTALVTLDVLRKRGINPHDPIAEMYVADVAKAEAELKEAADSKEGLFDLPDVDGGESAVTTGGPLGYSETSPYVGFSIERRLAREEDNSERGTGDVDE